MKSKYSTFDLLLQKTSLHIDSQVNNLKNVTQINGVAKKYKITYVPYTIKGQYIGCTLIRLKRRKFNHNLSKAFS